jgi:hypothetical protein
MQIGTARESGLVDADAAARSLPDILPMEQIPDHGLDRKYSCRWRIASRAENGG